jgi:putative peptidoglycan lipid II flippase
MSKLRKSAMFLALISIFAKLSGFLRESIIAKEFGANAVTDGYLLAFSIVTLLVAMVSFGFNNAFLPLYIKHKDNDRNDENASAVINNTVLIFLLLAGIGYFSTPFLLPLLLGNIHPDTLYITVQITKYFILFIWIIVLNGMLESLLQSKRIFVPSQIAKLMMTVMTALFALLFSEELGIKSLAYGFIFGSFLGFMLQVFYIWKSDFKWTFNLHIEKKFRNTFLIILIPALLNSVVGQLNLFIDKLFASHTVGGAITYLNNSSLLVSIPTALFATVIASILFTVLSEKVKDSNSFQQTLFQGIEIAVLLLLPVTLLLLLLGKPAIAFIYERGMFTSTDTDNTFSVLLFYLPLVMFQGLQYVISKSLYAHGKTKAILYISLTTIAFNILFNALLVNTFGYRGLALSSSLVALYFLTVTSIVLFRSFETIHITRRFMSLLKFIPANAIMVASIITILTKTNISNLAPLWQLTLLGLVGAISYGIAILLFHPAPIKKVLSR